MGVEYYPLAGIYNAVNANTRATGNYKKAPPRIDPWPVPALAAEAAKKKRLKGKVTVASLYAALFSNRAALPSGMKE